MDRRLRFGIAFTLLAQFSAAMFAQEPADTIQSPRLIVPNAAPAAWDDVSEPAESAERDVPPDEPLFVPSETLIDGNPIPPPSDLPPPIEVEQGLPDIVVQKEPSWLSEVVDEHLLIWRELPGAFEYIPGDGDSFGLTTVTFDSVVRLESSHGVWIVPKFGWHFLSGPRSPALPAQLYTLALEVNFAINLDASTRLHMHFAPTWATDFEANGSDSFRMIGGALLAHDLSQELMVAVGGVYLDRPDLPFLPLGGLRWKPEDYLEFDIMFPQPRAAWRFNTDDDGDENWFYIGGALGGDSWAFDRIGGPGDIMGYRDLRIMIGFERRETDGTRHVLEAGYVFDRRLDFDRGPGDQNLPGTAVIRYGSVY